MKHGEEAKVVWSSINKDNNNCYDYDYLDIKPDLKGEIAEMKKNIKKQNVCVKKRVKNPHRTKEIQNLILKILLLCSVPKKFKELLSNIYKGEENKEKKIFLRNILNQMIRGSEEIFRSRLTGNGREVEYFIIHNYNSSIDELLLKIMKDRFKRKPVEMKPVERKPVEKIDDDLKNIHQLLQQILEGKKVIITIQIE